MKFEEFEIWRIWNLKNLKFEEFEIWRIWNLKNFEIWRIWNLKNLKFEDFKTESKLETPTFDCGTSNQMMNFKTEPKYRNASKIQNQSLYLQNKYHIQNRILKFKTKRN